MTAMMLSLTSSFATTLVMPPDGDVVGDVEYAHPQAGETLAEVGLRYDIGYYEMLNANPGIDPHSPLSPNLRLLIPSQYILPPAPRQGIIVNLAEYRLYFFPKNDNVVITYPVGIGHKGWSTPLGLTKVVGKQANPSWHPTAKLIAEASRNGVAIPDVFPPGSGNPLGKHVLRLGWPTYLIHGTNRTDGIGERVSAGCIRMLPNDIEYLFEFVTVGTSVRVINEALKFGSLNGASYMEAHPLLAEQKHVHLQRLAASQLAQKNMHGSINQRLVSNELSHPTGIPRKLN